MKIEERLKQLGITLPDVGKPMGTYVHAVQTGNCVYLAGKGPFDPKGGPMPSGKVGGGVTIDKAYQDARTVGLPLISALKDHLGDLDRVTRVVKVLGMVNAVPDFGDQPKVINGCSDLFVEVFGDKGRHARSAVGMGSLPMNITVEIEAIVEVK